MQNENWKYHFVWSLRRSYTRILIMIFLPIERSCGTSIAPSGRLFGRKNSPKKYFSPVGATLFILFGLTFMSSCLQDTKSTEKTLDSLALSAWEAEAEITGIETEAWKNLCTEAKQKVEFINLNFKDTMNRETALAIDNYMRAAKMLEAYVNDFETIKKQVHQAAEQVTKLKEDFTKQAQSLDSIIMFAAREEKNLQVLNQAVAAKTNFAREQAELVQQYAPQVNSVIENLKSNE